MVQEIYTTKNRYFDKFPKFRNVIFKLVGDSVLFASSTTEVYFHKRKSLSAAFFKDKLTNMMQTFIKVGYDELTPSWESQEYQDK
eukprot:CAMPEP_0170548790 /NCGR_PEP_ID=MMETSP0211-20121228/6980_1 /TAXON_ID=311385 /ORGANISM="Pseudokeronopsis sp., Strain OXSARD2" /LENGTH=84 /DNA_ID=CAMNT_0010854425 /DNA_START=265 /DNA_END=519 /DNA_ORIENTATION=+